MTPAHCFKSRSLILATVLVCGLGLFTHANAQVDRTHAFLVDLNSRSATVIDPGTLGNFRHASGINDAGQVAGSFLTAEGDEHAFITGPDGVGMRDLGTLGGNFSEAFGINDAGQVVGQAPRAFITGPDGVGMRGLGTLGGYSSSAHGINEAGQVVGSSETTEGFSHAFITGPDGVGMRDLGVLGGGSTPDNRSYASGINNAGQVVGQTTRAESLASHAFITGPNGMGMTDLGTLGGVYSSAYDINDAGQVVGESATASGALHAFITGPNGVAMTDLGTLGYHSRAYGINDVGQVVGESQTAEGDYHAFISPDGKGMVDLNSLVDLPDGVILTQAAGINNNGQVIAMGMEVMGVIPEPETYALMLAGLGLIGFMGRRKKAEDSHSGAW